MSLSLPSYPDCLCFLKMSVLNMIKYFKWWVRLVPGHGLGERPGEGEVENAKDRSKNWWSICAPEVTKRGGYRSIFDRGISFGPRNRTVYLTGEVGIWSFIQIVVCKFVGGSWGISHLVSSIFLVNFNVKLPAEGSEISIGNLRKGINILECWWWKMEAISNQRHWSNCWEMLRVKS